MKFFHITAAFFLSLRKTTTIDAATDEKMHQDVSFDVGRLLLVIPGLQDDNTFENSTNLRVRKNQTNML